MKKIDIFIVGAQKAGTSSLKALLAKHPLITTHTQNELTFFVNDDEYVNSSDDWIEEHFPLDSNDNVLLAKSVGVMYEKRFMRRLAEHNPEMKIVLLLRDPVERAYSAYWYARRKGWEDIESFEDAIFADESRFGDDWLRKRNCDYLGRGRYVEHISNIYSLFPRHNVQLYKIEDLKNHPNIVCNKIFYSLNLPEFEIDSIATKKRVNASAMPRSEILLRLLSFSYIPRPLKNILPKSIFRALRQKVTKWNERPYSPPPLSKDTREKLKQYYDIHNKELSELTGLDIANWT